jgi:hypothetical protein
MDAGALQRQALREVGDNGRDTLWEVSLPISTSGGTWPLLWIGGSTAPVAYNATPAQVQTALEARPNIGTGNVIVRGVPGGPYRIQFAGALGGQSLPASSYPLTANGASLVPASTLVAVQLDAGESQALATIVTEIYTRHSAVTNEELLSLYIRRDLLYILLGESQKGIDVQTAQKMEKFKDQHDNLLALQELTLSEIHRLQAAGAANQTAAGRGPSVRPMTKKTPNGLPYGVLGFDRTRGRFS